MKFHVLLLRGGLPSLIVALPGCFCIIFCQKPAVVLSLQHLHLVDVFILTHWTSPFVIVLCYFTDILEFKTNRADSSDCGLLCVPRSLLKNVICINRVKLNITLKRPQKKILMKIKQMYI